MPMMLPVCWACRADLPIDSWPQLCERCLISFRRVVLRERDSITWGFDPQKRQPAVPDLAARLAEIAEKPDPAK